MNADWFLFVTSFSAGACIGSFINLAAWRMPTLFNLVDDAAPRGDLVSPRSYCPACRAPIARRHLFPVISFLLLGGRCAECSARIALRDPVVELSAGFTALIAVAFFGWTFAALGAALFGFALLLLATIDADTGYLPDVVTLPLLAAGIVANIFAAYAQPFDSIAGALAGYAVFRLAAISYRALRGREGLGQGDAKLAAAIGAWCGWAMLPPVVLVGATATLAYVAARMLSGRPVASDEPVPFGPGLCLGGLVALFGARAFAAGF